MHEMLVVLGAVAPVFILMVGGWIVRRLDWLTEEADASLLRVTVRVLMPALAFDTLLGNPALAQSANLFWPPLLGVLSFVLGLVLAGLARYWIRECHPRTRPTFAYSVAVFNYGYIPLPLALVLFDRETVAVLFLFNVGVELGLWLAGPRMLAGSRPGAWWKRVLSPPVVAIVGTLLLDRAVGETAVPGFIRQAAHWIGQCAVPVGLMLTGAIMADHRREFVSPRGGRVMLLACLLRLGLIPAFFVAGARMLPVNMELKRVLVLQAAMPAAVFPMILARHYGGDPVTAMRVVAATTLVGLFTLPLWLRFGLGLIARGAAP